MARVHLSGELRRLAAGRTVIDVDAASVVQLIDRLEERFPDMKGRLRDGIAVAIDGEVMTNADYLPLGPDSEVHLLPAISGG
ncbi:MoaD/ThiS family protein [Actinomycetota bacterium]